MIHISAQSAGRSQAPCPEVMPTSYVMATLRYCAKDLGISAQVMRTLEVLLSCLAPKRNHHVVFASNATLVARAGGLSERSIRRHIADLVALDFVERADSANGKRYCRKDSEAGLTLRFGLDFAKLFLRLPQLVELASLAQARAQKLRYLRCKLRAACQRILRQDPENAYALEYLKILRRNLSVLELETLLTKLPLTCGQEAETLENPPAEPKDLATTAGQNDRLQSSFSKEQLDMNESEALAKLLDHCNEAQSFAIEPIQSEADMVEHAKKLAPMIGISSDLWERAAITQSMRDLGALVWMMVQNLPKIGKPAAYFQALTIGKKSGSFAPWVWLQRQAI